jgi:hypothetical protein
MEGIRYLTPLQVRPRRVGVLPASATVLRVATACMLAFTGTALLGMQGGVRTAMEADIRQPDFAPERYRELIDGVFLFRFGGPAVLFLAAAAACLLLTVFHSRAPARLDWLGWPVWGVAVLCWCYLALGKSNVLDLLVPSTYEMVVFHVERHEGAAPAWRLTGSLALWVAFPAACLCEVWWAAKGRYDAYAWPPVKAV